MDILDNIKYAFSDILNFFKNFTDYFRMYIVEPIISQTRYSFSDVLNFFKNFTDYFRMYIVEPLTSQTKYMFSSVFNFFDNIAYNLNRYIIEPITFFIKTTFQSLFDFISNFSNILYTSIVEPFINFFNEIINNVINFFTIDFDKINQCIIENQNKVITHFNIDKIFDLINSFKNLFTSSKAAVFSYSYDNMTVVRFEIKDFVKIITSDKLSIASIINIFLTILFINYIIKTIRSEIKV